MGKPYASELQKLPAVYAWATEADIAPLVEAITALSQFPLIVVGSGGSLTTAHLASLLHQSYARRLARTFTPLEIARSGTQHELGALLITAGGRNPDIIGAFRTLAVREPRELAVVCSSTTSPISEVAKEYWYSKIFEFAPPSGRDGFVATNTLLSTAVLLLRAYDHVFGNDAALPPELDGLFGGQSGFREFLQSGEEGASPVLNRESLLVLHGVQSFPAASDIESKFSEVALGPVQLSDYRNFAHGRHHWLDARGDRTGVLAIVTDDDAILAGRTLALFPSNVAVLKLSIPGSGAQAAIAALVAALHFVEWAGHIHGVDPGRPSIAEFGRKLYHLNAFNGLELRNPSHTQQVAIERKSGVSVHRLRQNGELMFWETSLETFITGLESAAIRAIVFDYDGTLCAPASRFNGIGDNISDGLVSLLREGMLIGVATGRGRSVRNDLRTKIPDAYWDKIWVGYYNAGEIGLLSDESVPNRAAAAPGGLQQVAELLLNDDRLRNAVELELRSSQIAVLPKKFGNINLWETLQQLPLLSEYSIVRSTHSVDILAPNVSKLNLVVNLERLLPDSAQHGILRLGDLGRWPGNDYQLLAHPLGLSVDQVSSDPVTCWNLAPPGHRGIQATLDYLHSLNVDNGIARFDRHALGLRTTR
jgi:fructoselysine-6-P-deglycase FrlB-like protein